MMNATHETVDALRKQLWDLRLAKAPYRDRVVLLDRIAAAEREAGPRVPAMAPRPTCCPAAVVEHGCTCAYVTRCAEHGVRHHGTHD